MNNDEDFLTKKPIVNKDFCSLVAFLTVVVILCSLFFSSMDCFAISSGQLIDYYNISPEVYINDENYLYSPFLTTDEQDSYTATNYSALYQAGFRFNSSSDLDTSYTNYLLTNAHSNDRVTFNIYPSNSFICFDDVGYFAVYIDSTIVDNLVDNDSNDVASVYFDDGYTDGQLFMTSFSIYDKQTIDSNEYYMTKWRSVANDFLSSSMPVYHVSDCSSVSSVSDLDNINSNSSGGDGETSKNNLFLKSGYFTWTTPKTGYYKQNWAGQTLPNLDNMFKGSVTFQYTLTSYQIAHPEQFKFKFTRNINYDVYSYDNGAGNSPVRHAFKDNFGGVSFEVDFADIVNNNSYSRTMYDLMKDFSDIYFSSQWDKYRYNIDVENSKFVVVYSCTVVDNNGNESSKYTDTFDFINNKATNTEHGITNNNYPYTPSEGSTSPAYDNDDIMDNQTGYGSVPTATSQNSQNYGGYGGVTQINNNTNTNNGGDLIDYADTMIKDNAGDGDGYTEQLAGVTESNSFISYMSHTFSFIPEEYWDKLGSYFLIFLGILVAYFVLRMLLDIL